MSTVEIILSVILFISFVMLVREQLQKKSPYPTLDNSVQFHYERYQVEHLKNSELEKTIEKLNHEISELKIDNDLQYRSSVAATIANIRLSRAFATLAENCFTVHTDSELVDKDNPYLCFATKEECFPLKKHSWYSPEANYRVDHKGKVYYSKQNKISPMLTAEVKSISESFNHDTNNNIEDSLHE